MVGDSRTSDVVATILGWLFVGLLLGSAIPLVWTIGPYIGLVGLLLMLWLSIRSGRYLPVGLAIAATTSVVTAGMLIALFR